MLKPAVRRRGRGAGRAALGQPPRPTSPLRRRSPRHSRRASGSQLLIARRGRDSGRRSTTSTKARSRVPRRAARRPSTASRRTSPRRRRRCRGFRGLLCSIARPSSSRRPPRPRAERRRGAAAASSPRACSSRPCNAQAGRASSWARSRPRWAHASSSGCAIPGTTCRALPPRDDDRFGRAHQLEEAFDLPTLVLDEVQTLSAVCEERYRVSLPMRGARAFSHESKTFRERQRET